MQRALGICIPFVDGIFFWSPPLCLPLVFLPAPTHICSTSIVSCTTWYYQVADLVFVGKPRALEGLDSQFSDSKCVAHSARARDGSLGFQSWAYGGFRPKQRRRRDRTNESCVVVCCGVWCVVLRSVRR